MAGGLAACAMLEPAVADATRAPDDARRGILRLRLQAPDKLDSMRRFYGEVLELPLVADSKSSMTVRAGGTDITFVVAPQREPYYHFAFNIPENLLASSKRWLAPRCPILKRPDGSDEYHFVSWNAHSIYFLDPAGNILEFIARHNLSNARQGEFNGKDILYASEIALVVDDVAETVQSARDALGIDVFAGSQSERFAAVGSDYRLLIVVKRGREWNSGHGRRTAEVWPLRATIRHDLPGRLESAEHRFEVMAG